MSIQEQMQSDLKAAMRAKESDRLMTIRMAIAAIKNEQIELQHELDDKEALAVLQREVKKRRDSAEAYRQANRPELAEQEEREIAVLQVYLPAQMSADELRPLVEQAIAELGASGPGDMSKVMPELMRRFKDRAEGKLINQVAREVLAKNG